MMILKMFASDLDGTLIAREGHAKPELQEEFAAMMGRQTGLLLAYVTGRHFEYATEGIIDSGLPNPDYLVCDVGTSIFCENEGSWILDSEYDQFLNASWGASSLSKIEDAVAACQGLERQEDYKQSTHKLSFYLEPGTDLAETAREISTIIEKMEMNASVVHSQDIDSDYGLIDILPPAVSKDAAILFLAKRHALEMHQVLYAGDSGNDLSVFLTSAASILVGNTPDSIAAKVRSEKQSGEAFFATEECIAGVIEGLRHFGIAG